MKNEEENEGSDEGNEEDKLRNRDIPLGGWRKTRLIKVEREEERRDPREHSGGKRDNKYRKRRHIEE